MQYTAEIEKKEKSLVEIKGEISYAELESFRSRALAKLGTGVKLDGFREGHIPEDILMKHVGEAALLGEMAEMALQDVYPKVMIEHSIEAIGRPRVNITKLAPDNPLGFTIETAVLPQVELPDYNAIAEKKRKTKDEPTTVTDTEVNEAIDTIRKNIVAADHASSEAGGAAEKDGISPQDEKGLELPELTDEFVGQLGDFTDVTDFKNKLKDNLEHEKAHKAREKRRLNILEAVLGETNIDIPQILIDGELDKMLAQFTHDIERMGMQREDYLKQAKKTEEDLKKEWRPDAEKRAKTQLVLNAIAQKEAIAPEQTEVDANVNHVLSQHPESKEKSTPEQKRSAKIYVTTILTNEKVFQFLEGKKGDSSEATE